MKLNDAEIMVIKSSIWTIVIFGWICIVYWVVKILTKYMPIVFDYLEHLSYYLLKWILGIALVLIVTLICYWYEKRKGER